MTTKGKARIVIVDDEPMARTLLRLIFERDGGHSCIMAEDGFDAVEIIQEYHPDLVIMDVTMPGMDGFAVCERLKSIKSIKNIPIILLSAKTDLASIKNGFEAGASKYLMLPISPEDLCRHASELIGNLIQTPASKIWRNNLPNEAFAIYKKILNSSPALDEIEDISIWLTEIADKRCISLLLLALQFEGNSQRSKIIETLGDLRVKEAIPQLRNLLNDVQPPIFRSNTAYALGMIGDPSTVSVLAKALHHDKDNSVAVAATAALGQIRIEDSIVHLVWALNAHWSKDVRETAAKMLGYFAYPTSVNPLANALHNDEDVAVAAANALGQIGNEASVLHLGQAVTEHVSRDVRETAANMLGYIASPTSVDSLAKALRYDKDEGVVTAIVDALSQIGNEASVLHLGQAVTEHVSRDVRETAANMLGYFASPTSVEPLAKALRYDKDEGVVIAVVDALGQIGNEASVLHLGQAVTKHVSRDVRETAANMLGYFASPTSVEPLAKVLHNDEDEDVAKAVAEALGQIVDAQSTFALRLALREHPSKAVRKTIKRILDHIEKIQNAKGLLRSNDLEVRGESVIQLAELAKNIKSLRSTKAQETFWHNVRHSLSSMRSRRDAQQKWGRMSRIAYALTGESPERQNRMLQKTATHFNNQDLQYAALSALGQNQDKGAVKVFIQSIKHKNPKIRRVAVDGLGRLKIKETINVAINLLNDPSSSVQLAAISALVAFDATEAYQALENVLHHSDKSLRIDATKALGDSKRKVSTRLLIECLKYEKNADVLHSAIQALGSKDIDSSLETVLLPFLDHPSEHVREAAERVVEKLRSKM